MARCLPASMGEGLGPCRWHQRMKRLVELMDEA